MKIINGKTLSKSVLLNSSFAAVLLMGASAAVAHGGFRGNVVLTDIDGDGVISAEEIRSAREATGADRVTRFDTDGDGQLSKNERKAMKEYYRAQAAQRFDTNGDGELSRDERRAARAAAKNTVMLQLDVNGDGELTDTEKAGWEEVRAERKEGKLKRHGKRSGDQAETTEQE